MSKLTVTRILEIIETTVNTWVKSQGSEASIARTVAGQLDKAANQIALHAIGVRKDSFSRVEIETRSPGWKLIAGKIEAAAQAWLAEIDFDPNLDQTKIADLKRHYEREYEQQVRKLLAALAEAKAKEDAASIVENVGLSTDAMCEALGDLIEEEQTAEAIAEAARGKEFMQRTKIKNVEVKGVVAYDGDKLSLLTQEPDATCWHVVYLEAIFGDVSCHVLTNGREWHPFNPVFANDVLNCKESEVLDSFISSRQMIFNFLDDADRLCIKAAIASHYQKKKPAIEEEMPAF